MYVSRKDPTSGVAATVNYRVLAGSATAADYTCSATGTRIDDTVGENDETFTVELTTTDTPGAFIDTSRKVMTVTILTSNMGNVEFNPYTYTVAEDAGYANLAIKRTNTSGICTIQYQTVKQTTSGAAEAGEDFEGESGTVSFGAGESHKTLRISIEPGNLYHGHHRHQRQRQFGHRLQPGRSTRRPRTAGWRR